MLEHGLANEVVLLVYPVLLGAGKRFFAEGTPARSFYLVGTEAMPSGITLGTYRVAGRAETVQEADGSELRVGEAPGLARRRLKHPVVAAITESARKQLAAAMAVEEPEA